MTSRRPRTTEISYAESTESDSERSHKSDTEHITVGKSLIVTLKYPVRALKTAPDLNDMTTRKARSHSSQIKSSEDEYHEFSSSGESSASSGEFESDFQAREKRRQIQDFVVHDTSDEFDSVVKISRKKRKRNRKKHSERQSVQRRRILDASDDDTVASSIASEPDNGDEEEEEAPTAKREKRVRRLTGDEDEIDADSIIEKETAISLAEELAELQSSANEEPETPPKLNLRERKGINYHIPPPPTNNDMSFDTGIYGTPSRRRKGTSMPQKRLFDTSGPFGGAGTQSLFTPVKYTGAAIDLYHPIAATITNELIDSDSDDNDMSMLPKGNTRAPDLSGGPTPFNLAPLSTDQKPKKTNLADTDPVGVDSSVNFESVGGLDDYIDKLKEMVALPLLYPEVFSHFNVSTPKGVLFHGPPGTGKTLMARALAASCSQNGQKISFYMRKGADCLSKWVGEAERQLRLLFEEARKHQPSIIFFDEIDGLAPVRSSKQEQIHASIVSTLLALMDGMDNRGQVIIIGATNRPDSIDPALRRPGRFDREFYFPLPNLEARKSILKIHTSKWSAIPGEELISNLAEMTKGFGGADLRALCTEAVLNSIRRSYPQIYMSAEKLLVDPSTIKVTGPDFLHALKNINPSSARSTSALPQPLPEPVKELLLPKWREICDILDVIFPRPPVVSDLKNAISMYNASKDLKTEQAIQSLQKMRTYRPRLMVLGDQGNGQEYLLSAILARLDGVFIQSFDIDALQSDSNTTQEAAVIQLFAEVKRRKPSVMYIADWATWLDVVPTNVKAIFFKQLRTILPTDPILFVAMSQDGLEQELSLELLESFGGSSKAFVRLENPQANERRKFFRDLIKYIKTSPDMFSENEAPSKPLPVLPKAPILEKKPEEIQESNASIEREYIKLKNSLKIKLGALSELLKVRYKRFRKPAIDASYLAHLFEPAPPGFGGPHVTYGYEIAERNKIIETETGKLFNNMDLDVIEERIWNGYYSDPRELLYDIEMILEDANTLNDRERIIKAQEMVTNATVFVDDLMGDAAFVTVLSRLRELEKMKKRRAKEEAVQDKSSKNLEIEPASKQDANGETEKRSSESAEMVNGALTASDTHLEQTAVENGEDMGNAQQNVVLENSDLNAAVTDVQVNVAPVLTEPREVILDEATLETFMQRLVEMTADLTVEKLEIVNSALLDIVWNERHAADKFNCMKSLFARATKIVKELKPHQL
ncbi:hypothetical protein CANCADRAFT_95567 [Tortispora caseinolytica NRRL Y-17796]|uniref:Bromo domain-containing protein n=1 Tax=Tortispora caseinolytica NRRL Y-17796 TaxID=767744 RepID=A0A1E4TMT7_9ASCO|nr:hypothetical protein CANCADRAFT_95567 [Tortispora caseinolytica NRRL Y-17796]